MLTIWEKVPTWNPSSINRTSFGKFILFIPLVYTLAFSSSFPWIIIPGLVLILFNRLIPDLFFRVLESKIFGEFETVVLFISQERNIKGNIKI